MSPRYSSAAEGEDPRSRLDRDQVDHGAVVRCAGPSIEEEEGLEVTLHAGVHREDAAELERHLETGSTFAYFFAGARLDPNELRSVEDPLMQQIRYLDKLVDELAKGRALEEVLRT